jgi:hypothetical protein
VLKDKCPKSQYSSTDIIACDKTNGTKNAYSNPIVSLDDEVSPTDKNSRKDVNGEANEKKKSMTMERTKINEDISTNNHQQTERKPTLRELMKDMFRPQMLKPLAFSVTFFVFHHGSGFTAMRPYLVKIFEELRFPVDAYWATVRGPNR